MRNRKPIQRRISLLIACAGSALLSLTAFAQRPPAPPHPPAPPLDPRQIHAAPAASPIGPDAAPGAGVLSADDEAFLDDLERRGIQFFIDEADPVTGLMPDRARANGGESNGVASTASVGFGLTALCIADERGWISHEEAYARSFRVLDFLLNKVPNHRGHYFHFLDMHTGARMWECEVSNIDTALLMAGVLTVRQHFPDTELSRLADAMYRRVEWTWLMDEDGQLHHGWKPETGILKAKWGAYSEGPPLILLLGMGSPTYPLPARCWDAWKREPILTYAGLTFIQCPPLFTHQFPQCWFDLRGQRDAHADYFKNGQLATLAQRQWFIDELSKQFPEYGPNMWGLTASDYQDGYTAWGGPPQQGDIDGTVVPCAAAGSLAFEPRLCLDALRNMKQRYGDRACVKYGFVDAFNPSKDWYNRDVIGIDVGPTVLMAENCRSGFVWKTFMSCPEAQAALKLAGFRPTTAEERALTMTSVFGSGVPRGAAGAER